MARPSVPDLARAFYLALVDQVGEDGMAEIRRLNRAETNPDCCHSHDLCDANQSMLDAMAGLGYEPRLDEEDVELINSAWRLAGLR